MTPRGSDREDEEKETPKELNTEWHHALELQADMQQRTFQALLNVTLSDSRDNRSHGKDVRELNVGSTGQ